MTAAVSDEILVAFVHGELAEADIARVEAALADDPALEARLAALAAQDDAIRNAFAGILDGPVPARLVATVEQTQPEAQVVDFAAFRARKAERRWVWGWPQGAAIAASLAIGLIVGTQVDGPAIGAGDPLVVASVDGPRLSRSVEAVLASAKSGERKMLASVGTASVTISFKTVDGALCRQFAIDGKAGTTDGVACREGQGWRLHALGLRPGETGEMRTASGDAAPAVLAAVDALIAGEPLDAEAEAKSLATK